MVKSNQTPDIQPQLPFSEDRPGSPNPVASGEMALAGLQRAAAKPPKREVPQEAKDAAERAAGSSAYASPLTRPQEIREQIIARRIEDNKQG